MTGGFVFPVNLLGSVSVCVGECVFVLEENVRETVICYISKHSSSEILEVCERTHAEKNVLLVAVFFHS